FHKKYPEIKITGVFNRGADVAKRLMAERSADKFLADVYVNGLTTGYNVFYKAEPLDRSRPSSCCVKLLTRRAVGAESFSLPTRRISICSISTVRIAWSLLSTQNS